MLLFFLVDIVFAIRGKIIGKTVVFIILFIIIIVVVMGSRMLRLLRGALNTCVGVIGIQNFFREELLVRLNVIFFLRILLVSVILLNIFLFGTHFF